MKLSIIIPIYNVQEYLEECLRSVEKQNIEDFEVILVNDGSVDKSREIAIKFCDKNHNFILIDKVNGGLPDARNVGFSYAKGEYIFFLDSDDYLKNSNILNECCNYAINKDLDVLMFDAQAFKEKGSDWEGKEYYYERGNHIKEKQILSGIEFIEKYFPIGQYRVAVYLYILKREFLIKNNLYELKALRTDQDNEFTFRILLNARRTEYINKRVVCRRVRNNSLSMSKISKKKCDCIIYVLYNDIKHLKKVLCQLSYKQKNVLYTVILSDFVDAVYKCTKLDKNDSIRYLNFVIRKFIPKYYKEINSELNIDYINYIIKVIKMLDDNNISTLYLENIIRTVYKLKGDMEIREFLYKEKTSKIKSILEKIDFTDSNKCIGIYGAGRYADNLLNFYETNIAKIESKIIFIDTFKKSYSEKYLDRDVINIKEVKKLKIDKIIIASMYTDEILERISEEKVQSNIYTLNNNNSGVLFN